MANTKKETTVEPVEEYDIWKDMVKIKIPRDPSTKEDVVVWINDRVFTIMRNVEVEVPRPVYERLMDIEKAIEERDAFIDENRVD